MSELGRGGLSQRWKCQVRPTAVVQVAHLVSGGSKGSFLPRSTCQTRPTVLVQVAHLVPGDAKKVVFSQDRYVRHHLLLSRRFT